MDWINNHRSLHKPEELTTKAVRKRQRRLPAQARQVTAVMGLVVILLMPIASIGRILSESDFKQAESLKPLFANLMNDLVATSKHPDATSGDVGCVNSTIRELLQISDELASYEYLITMEKEITDVGDDSPMRDVVRFAVEKSDMILAD
ncbi:MAG: hypothetical protein WCB02_10425, partial [Bradyrhizobium sp.]